MPNLEPKTIEREMNDLKWRLYEIDHDAELTKMEKLFKEKVAKGLHRPQKKKKEAVKNG